MRTKKVIREDVVAEVEEVESAENVQKESDLGELQRVVAECEVRIATINEQVDDEVKRRVDKFMTGIAVELDAREQAICSRIVEFFHQAPFWEVMKVSKSTHGGSSGFHNPYLLYKKFTAQGWRWIGQYFDEQAMERYDLFLRPKNLPGYFDRVEEFFAKFKVDRDKHSAAVSAPAKKVVVKLASKSKK